MADLYSNPPIPAVDGKRQLERVTQQKQHRRRVHDQDPSTTVVGAAFPLRHVSKAQNEDNVEQLVNESNEKVCTSKFKIESALEMLEDIPADDQSSVNIVIDLNIISELLKIMARCKVSSAAKTFCSVMNLPPPPAKFQRYNGILLESLSKVSDASMKKAVEETIEMNNSNRDITAAFDGSWQKRGHTSLNGVVSATSLSL
ncbi:uncharacterized protein TNCV_397661 [Trichonephila clavipes]|nr:uncharacterized protein TNCV_397661 [Trichonephila clavipes]